MDALLEPVNLYTRDSLALDIAVALLLAIFLAIEILFRILSALILYTRLLLPFYTYTFHEAAPKILMKQSCTKTILKGFGPTRTHRGLKEIMFPNVNAGRIFIKLN